MSWSGVDTAPHCVFCNYCVFCDDCEVVCCVSGDDAVVHGWNDSVWEEAGLGDLVAEGYRRIGLKVLVPGKAIGNGLTQKSADEMGLRSGTAIATSLIDAHAGGVGTCIYIIHIFHHA